MTTGCEQAAAKRKTDRPAKVVRLLSYPKLPRVDLRLERTSASARFDRVRIVERKTSLLQTVEKIERGTIQEQRALFVHDNFQIMQLEFGIGLVVKRLVKAQ